MLVRIKPLTKRRFGLIVDVRPTILRVIIDEPCPIHNRPFTYIMKLEGDEPANGCIECAIDLLNALNETIEEHNNAQDVNGA